MPNIFDYKPNLQYQLGEIDSIDNVKDGQVEIKESLLRNRGSNAVEAIDSNLAKIDAIKATIDERLKNVTVPINPRAIDDLVTAYADGHSDGQKLIKDKIITYGFYKYSLDKDALQQVTYAWDMHHAGVDGMIEAELLPQVLSLEEDLISVKEIVNQTVNYDKAATNIEDLKQMEVRELENYAELNRQLDNIYTQDNPDMEELKAVRKRLTAKESKLKLKKVISNTAIKFARGATRNIDIIESRLDLKEQEKRREIHKEQANKVMNKLTPSGYDARKIKLLTYQGFKAKRDEAVSRQQDIQNTSKVKKPTYQNIITNTRLYLDVAMPALNELEHTRIEDDEEIGFKHLIDGMADMVYSKQNAMIELKNSLKVSTQTIYTQVKKIIEKDETRILYKSF